MEKLKFLKIHWPKFLSVFLFIILIGAYVNIFAIGSPYSPGATLDPACAPNDPNCTVLLNTTEIDPITGAVNGLVKSNGSGAIGAVISGIDIKTINSTSLLGSGDIVVGGLSSDADFNTKGGTDAGFNLVAGAQNNTFLGYEAGKGGVVTNAFDYNTAIGSQSLYSGTTGPWNTAVGYRSLYSNTTGNSNVAIGYRSLYSNTTGYSNIATGSNSLYFNTTGNSNIASGYQSLYRNTTGRVNTAIGSFSMVSNVTGEYNTANGSYSLYSSGLETTAGGFVTGIAYTIITTGTTDFTLIGAVDNNPGTVFTATGVGTGNGTASSNTNYNTAFGAESLYSIRTGDNNTALGYRAGRSNFNGSSVSFLSNSLYLGYDTRSLADGDTNEIVIGASAIGNGSNTTTIGTGNVLYIGGSSISGKAARFTNSAGYCDINPLTTSLSCTSDINLKKNIKKLDEIEFALQTIPDTKDKSVLEKINLLTPVKYNWKTEGDNDSTHIGFIAQEIEQVFPDLVFTDTVTGVKSVAFTNLIPYTVKAIQELDLKVKDLSSLDTTLNTSLGSLIKEFLANAGNNIDLVFFGEVHAKKLCLDDICITKDELKQILEKNNVGMINNSSQSIEENNNTTQDENSTDQILQQGKEAISSDKLEETPKEETSQKVETSSEQPIEQIPVEQNP